MEEREWNEAQRQCFAAETASGRAVCRVLQNLVSEKAMKGADVGAAGTCDGGR